MVPIGRGRRGGVIFKSLKGGGLRKVNVLINYDLMSKDGSDREGKERMCSNLKGGGMGCGEAVALGVGISIDYARMFKRFLVEGKQANGRKCKSS